VKLVHQVGFIIKKLKWIFHTYDTNAWAGLI